MMQASFTAPGAVATDYLSMCTLIRELSAGRDIGELFNPDCGDDANMVMRMAMLFNIYGDHDSACELQAKALALRQHYHLAAARPPAQLRLLVILKPGFMLDNTPVEFLLEGSDVACELLYVTEDGPLPERLPEHDVAFVAMGQFLRHRACFERISPLLSSLTGAVLNRPTAAFGCERDRLSTLLQGIAGLVVPQARTVSRAALRRIAEGGQLRDGEAPVAFPAIVRPWLSQAGTGLERLDDAPAVAAYLARQPDTNFYIAPFVDYAGADGLYRKYRLLLLRGKPYACHMALRDHWMVHYQTAGMEESAAKREEEARFMAGFDEDFGRRHGPALGRIAERTGLDYLVVDCAETADGQLLFFEADNISIVHALDSDELFPYKRVQMRKVFQAFRAMLEEARDST